MAESSIPSFNEVAEDNLDEIVDLLGEYNSNCDPNAFCVFLCSRLDQFCQDLDEELLLFQALEDELDLDLALNEADLSLDEGIFDNIPEEQQDGGKPAEKEIFVSLQIPVGVEDNLRLQFKLRPCSVILQRLDLPLTSQAETKNRRKRKRTEDADWMPPVVGVLRKKSAVAVLRRSPRNICKLRF
jgi:hypothetical protein